MSNNGEKNKVPLSLGDLRSQIFLEMVVWKVFSAQLASLKFPQCLEVFSQQEIIRINTTERAVGIMLKLLQKAKDSISAQEVDPPDIDLVRELLFDLKNQSEEMRQFISGEKNKVFDRFTPSVNQFMFYPLSTLKFIIRKLLYKILNSRRI